ncbi:MAG TPA: hypothetical protein VL335_02500 [Candidatus Paceibacterota bacterium]|jgi:hypothetical protein|nr:hypothetical protein [Candidatus Paceibacterota bacterium]
MSLKRIFSSPWTISALSGIALILINWSDFYLYWSSPFIQGWDGQGHASIGEYYSDHIFPSTWGWVSQWYAGMPFPQFYPPLFYFVMAIFHHILPFISYITTFKAFVIILQLSLPAALTFFVAHRKKSVSALWFTGIFSVLLTSSHYDIFGGYGMNTMSTFHTGMIAQLLGFVFLIAWLHYFLQIEQNIRARYLSILFLFLTFLANAHNDIVTFLIFVTIFLHSFVPLIVKMIKKEEWYKKEHWLHALKLFLLYFLCGAIPLIATSFWTVPLLYTYTYFVTGSLFSGPSVSSLLMSVWLLPFIAMIVFFVHKKIKNRDALILMTSILLVVALTYLPNIYHLAIPTHINRWFGVVIFMLPIVCGLIYDDFLLIIDRFIKHRILIFILGIIIIFVGTGSYRIENSNGFYFNYDKDHFDQIVSYIQSNKKDLGITAVESVEVTDTPKMFIYDSIFGQYGDGAATFVLRESSINSLFMTPIRNSISLDHESWGLVSFLVFNDHFLKQNITDDLDRAEKAGIQSFFVRSKYTKDLLNSDQRISLKATFGNWQLFAFKTKTVRAEIFSYKPIVFYGNLTFKDRWNTDYDWNRLQEELLFWNKKKIILSYASNQLLDTSTDLYLASTTVITSYHYIDEITAARKLISYSKTNHLILVAERDPLFFKIKDIYLSSSTTKKYNITLVDHLSNGIIDDDPLENQLGTVFANMEHNDLYPYTTDIHIKDTHISDSRIQVELSGTSTVPLPILVKTSYFPAWQRADNEPIYLGSSAFMLTYATSSFEINFTTPTYVKIGWYISFIVLIGTVILYYFDRRQKRDWFVS